MLFYMDTGNHPIPQDITGFQFKLIGSMTIKQFAYLAGGFVFAWVFYILPIFFLVKLILVLGFAALGACLAFLPIEGRPLDLMLTNFIKAVFRPTQYVYEQTNITLDEKEMRNMRDFNKKRQTISEMSEIQLQNFLKTLPKTTSIADKKEMVFFNNVNQYQSGAKTQTLPGYVPQHAFANSAPLPQPVQNLPPLPKAEQKQPALPTPPIQPPAANLQKTNDALEKQLREAKDKEIAQENVSSGEFLEAHQKVLEMQKNLNDMQLQKQQLEEKLTNLEKQMTTQKQPIFSPTVATEQPQQTQFVRSIPQSMTKKVGLIAPPEFPNIISGIVKDPRGNPLSNILVEIKDAQGNAVRAFKTNALGQFVSATALGNGEYTIEFEDPREQNKFDAIGFKATGEIIMPIEVISVDTREELRRSLFN
jgi:hypothetical protein